MEIIMVYLLQFKWQFDFSKKKQFAKKKKKYQHTYTAAAIEYLIWVKRILN